MKILFVEPHESSLFSFRKELLDKLICDGHEIILCTESTPKTISYYASKTKIIDVKVNLKSKGIINNLTLKKKYKKIIKTERPQLIISYKIKPNIYCGLCAKGTHMIANITGLGNAFKKRNWLSKIGIFLYKKAFKNIEYVFFQNNDGFCFFKANHIQINNYQLIPGSGVNTKKFLPAPIEKDNSCINFLFASRALKEKGFDLLINAIPIVLQTYSNAHFNFLISEKEFKNNKKANILFAKYRSKISILNRSGNMEEVYLKNDFLISPSFYREGISNVLLESLACGRPIITTIDNPGCMEVLQDGINGFGVISNDLQSLVDAIVKALKLSKKEIETMGKNGRQYVVQNFEREIVINKYLETIASIERVDFNK